MHTLVFTPDRLAVVKGGPAARRAYFDRVLARVLPARADLPVGVCVRARAAERRAPPCRHRCLRGRRTRALDGAGRRARGGAGRRPPPGGRAARTRVCGARGRARPRGGDRRLRRRASDPRGARRATGARPGTRDDRSRAASRRRAPARRRSRSAHVRLPGGAADGGPLAAPRRGRRPHRPGRDPPAPAARRRTVGARRGAPEAALDAARQRRPDPRHRDRGGSAAPRPRAAPRRVTRPRGGGR